MLPLLCPLSRGHTGEPGTTLGGGGETTPTRGRGVALTANDKAPRSVLAAASGCPGAGTPGATQNKPLKNGSLVTVGWRGLAPAPRQAGPVFVRAEWPFVFKAL